jgi:hypothetical protein
MAMALSSSVPRFQCILTNDPEKASSDPLCFEQEEGKKSSFFLELDDAAGEIQKPAHVILQGGDSFLFGGLEFVSNARNVEIYLTENDKETYLTTSRGLLAGDDPYRFKCIVVCPGGPRAVARVHLKLLSLKPESCTGATLHLMKLKGRLPPPKQEEGNTQKTSATKSATTSSRSTDTAPPGLTQADMGAAMTGVTMLVRSVESNLLESVEGSLDKVEKRLGARLDRIEQYLVMQQQAALLQQQQKQRRFEDMQNQMMLQMKQHQSEMTSLITSLRARVAQPKEPDGASGVELPDSNEVNSDERHSGPKTESKRIPNKREGQAFSERDASMPPDSESRDIKHAAESLTMVPVESNEDLDTVNNVGESEHQEDAVAVALTDDSKQGDVIISAEAQSSRGMNSTEGQAEPTVELAKECNTTKDRDGDQPEVSRQELREAPSILELETTEVESVAIELVEPQDERLGANDPCETESQEDAVAAAMANDLIPDQEEENVKIEDAAVGTGGETLDTTEEYDDISRDQRVSVAQASESNPEVEEASNTPERRPVMEKRDNALEIPDLLADLSSDGLLF